MSVRIVTDSTSYLPAEQRSQYGIAVVSLTVSFADGTSKRELDIDDTWFYRHMSRTGEIPTSSQPAVAEMAEAFSKIVDVGDEVVGVFISSAMSGTFETAQLARNMVLERIPEAKIELVDSRANSMQLGMCALQAARAAEKGGDIEAVAQAARNTVSRTRFLFTPHDLEYLKRGGRIGGASALLGSLLQVKPILTIEDGEVDTWAKVRTKRRAMARIVDDLAAEAKFATLEEVAIHHIDDLAEGEELAALVAEKTDLDVLMVAIGPVVGLHVGPGTVGVVMRTRDEVRSLKEATHA